MTNFRFQMKNVATIVASFAVIIMFAGCDSPDSELGTDADSGGFDGIITAKVENGDAYNSLISKVKVRVGYDYESGDELWVSGNYVDGGFTLTLPATLSDKFCDNILMYYNGPTISDIKANMAHISWDFECYNSNDEYVGWIIYKKEVRDDSWGDDAYFIYVDRDVTVNGSEAMGMGRRYYDMSLKKGWNIAYEISSNSGSGDVVTTEEVSGFKWYIWNRYVYLSEYQLIFDSDDGTQEVTVNAPLLLEDWTFEKDNHSDWFSAVRSDDRIIITVDKNESGGKRYGYVAVVSSGSSVAEVSIEQEPRKLGTDAEFEAFTFAGIVGGSVIDRANRTITAQAEAATNLGAIAPEFVVSKGAKVYFDFLGLYIPQISGETQRNFTNPVEYIVISEAETTWATWTVSITKY